MIGHVGLYVENLEKSDYFYRPLLQNIGYEVLFVLPQCIAYGVEGKPFFEIYTGKLPSSPIHVAFHVTSKQEVESFYQRGLTLGATDNGKPGYRTYFSGYYAAYLTAVNGHNLEALYWDE
jgi:catechol 2,3-dioxygenase-like lactoylglutathione lyase family enzyme